MALVHFSVPGFAEHAPSVRTVILFIDHIAGIIVVAVHRAVGVFHRAHVSGRIQPDLMDHFARVIVLASHLGIAGGGSDAAAADIQIAFTEHTALVIQVDVVVMIFKPTGLFGGKEFSLSDLILKPKSKKTQVLSQKVNQE